MTDADVETPDDVAELIVEELYRDRENASRDKGDPLPQDWNTDEFVTIGDWKAAIVAVLRRLTA